MKKLTKREDPSYKRIGRIYVKVCKCDKELPLGPYQGARKYCSIKCAEKHGYSQRSKWWENLSDAQKDSWIRSNRNKGRYPLTSHGDKFFDEFDAEFGLIYAEIVGLMYRIQKYGKEVK